MRVIAVPAGIDPFEFIKSFLTGEEPAQEEATSQEEAPEEAPSDPVITIKSSELARLVNERDEAMHQLTCPNCVSEHMEEELHKMRVLGWALSRFEQGTRSLPTPVKWNDMPDFTRQQLIETAIKEVAAFDEAQTAS